MSNSFRILVAYGIGPDEELLLREVQRYALALDAHVDVVHVTEPDPEFVGYIKAEPGQDQRIIDPPRDSAAHALRRESRLARGFGNSLRASGVHVGEVLTIQGSVLGKLIDQAVKRKSDLVIVGSHHHGPLYRLWYGDVAEAAVGRMPCALLVLPPN